MTVFINSSRDFQNLTPGQVLKIENHHTHDSAFIIFNEFIEDNSGGFIFNAYELFGESETCVTFDCRTSLNDVFVVDKVSPKSSFVDDASYLKCSISSNQELCDAFVLEIGQQKPANKEEENKLVDFFGWRLVSIVKVLLLYKK